MRALTLWRPWPWAICRPSPRAKRVENRTWYPPEWLLGQDLAIHAGRKIDGDARSFCRSILGETPPTDGGAEGVVAVVTIAGWRDRIGSDWRLVDVPPHDGDPWFCGPVGWLLANVRVLPTPVPCPGHQGLWNLPPDVEEQVRRQIGNAKTEHPADCNCSRCDPPPPTAKDIAWSKFDGGVG